MCIYTNTEFTNRIIRMNAYSLKAEFCFQTNNRVILSMFYSQNDVRCAVRVGVHRALAMHMPMRPVAITLNQINKREILGNGCASGFNTHFRYYLTEAGNYFP